MTRRLVRALAALALLALPAAAAPPPDPWQALSEVRAQFAGSGPRVADFEQVYIPAGFAQGEKETGRLALSLPDCLRWDYGAPYPKSFLVCGNLAHYWSEQDGVGKRQRIVGREEPGLDLLLLGVAELSKRYRARAEPLPLGQVRIHLVPLQPLSSITEATLTLDHAAGVVSGLEYRDREGNLTRFVISRYSPLPGTELFTPPATVAWEDVEEP
ncbi:MAG TPA: outer membrane lipoprotein carrier protein LolA [Thermoanaerobaculia bacterium]|nr:outer membrane lipoprotein carrier protein LolA [Thermoanaerobaculia bacterium]